MFRDEWAAERPNPYARVLVHTPLVGPEGTYESDDFVLWRFGPHGAALPVGHVTLERRLWAAYKREFGESFSMKVEG